MKSDSVLPPVFWMRGLFSPLNETHSRQTTGKPTEILDDVWSFSISTKDQPSIYVRLLVDDSHFRYNIHQLISHPTTLGSNFQPEVRALLKSHGDCDDGRFFLATPLAIIATNKNG